MSDWPQTSRPYPGILITLEGGEGSGKSVQAERLEERLRAHLGGSRQIISIHEPGGTVLGEGIRHLLKQQPQRLWRRVYKQWADLTARGPLDPVAELLLFAAARAQLVSEVVRPHLERGDVVVSDRFADSTAAYQGYGRGLDLDIIARTNAIACQGMKPQLTILLDVPVEVGLARKGPDSKRDRLDSEERSFHQKVREGYLTIAAQEPERWLVLDGRGSPDDIAEAVWRRVRCLFKELR